MMISSEYKKRKCGFTFKVMANTLRAPLASLSPSPSSTRCPPFAMLAREFVDFEFPPRALDVRLLTPGIVDAFSRALTVRNLVEASSQMHNSQPR
jgi:hypothetical protein